MSADLSVTFLADNTVMELVPDSARVRRVSEPGRSFLAEHGFSALISQPDGTRVLFDAGATETVVPHNLEALGLDVKTDLSAAVLSHGHSDHAGCLCRLRCPIHAHPDVLGPRFLARGGEVRFDLTASALPFVRDRLVLSRDPVQVAPQVLTTGQIPRKHAWEAPRGFLRIRNQELVSDDVVDDQALVIITRRGLVVVAGCAHAGIINTVRHARQVTGIDSVHAVVGGFHLIDADAGKLKRTLEALRKLDAEVLAPVHCTGFAATAAIAKAFPEQFVYATGGHQISFERADDTTAEKAEGEP